MMIPQGSTLGNLKAEIQQQTSRTYRLDPVTKRISGMIDGIEAIKQAVLLILGTERFEHLIYSFNYGSELEEMEGVDSTIFALEVEGRIREALIHDDRISDVRDFKINISDDTALVEFTVVSIYGDFKEEKVVSRGVRRPNV